MNVQTKETYSEVYSVLNMLGENYIKKLPKSLFDMIKEEKDDSYNPQYIKNIQLSKQKIKRESLAMIALFHLNYWCESKEEKEELRNLFKTNEEKHQAELREKYNPDDIFKNVKKENITTNTKINSEVALVEIKDNLISRIINKIKNFFKRK